MIDLTQPLIFLDVETTGFDPVKNRITEVAAIRIVNGVEVQRFTSFVNIGEPVPAHITELTGITDNDLKDAPKFEDIVPILEHIFQGGTIVAHNAQFDIGFLKSGFIRAGKKLEVPYLCTQKLSKACYPSLGSYKLQTLIERFEFHYDARHRAYDDASVLVQLIDRMKQDLGEQKVYQLAGAL